MRLNRSLVTGIGTATVLALSLARMSAGGNTALATGSGHFHVAGELRTFTFAAATDASGVSSGQMEGDSRSRGVRWHGTIDCLTVRPDESGSGNRATMSGVITDVDPEIPSFFEVGFGFVFQVLDNGEGANAPLPDRISSVIVFPAQFDCHLWSPINFAPNEIEYGNVQVH